MPAAGGDESGQLGPLPGRPDDGAAVDLLLGPGPGRVGEGLSDGHRTPRLVAVWPWTKLEVIQGPREGQTDPPPASLVEADGAFADGAAAAPSGEPEPLSGPRAGVLTDADHIAGVGEVVLPGPDPVVVVPAGVAPGEGEAGSVSAVVEGWATHYGESYNGQPLGCSGAGVYRSRDPSIVAVGPARYREWPCGTQLLVRGPAGSVVVRRVDSCPGCGANVLDLSEAAHEIVCGFGTCRVTIQVLP